MDSILKALEDYRFIASIRSSTGEDAEAMIKAAMAGGFRIFEISMQTPQVIRLLENYSSSEGFIFGAGGVTDGEMAQRAIKAGARFITSYYTDRDVISVAKNNDVFVVQGALTPTEIVNAFQLGADLIRIYPAEVVGSPAYVKSIRSLFPFIKLMASGGITPENAFEYIRYCVAVTFGKSLFEKSLVRTNSWTEITERARQLVQKLEATKVSR